MTTKTCIKCQETKDVSEFHKRAASEDKLDYYCRFCRVGMSLISQKKHKKNKPCAINGCDKPHYAKSYCRTHYRRQHKNGTTDRLNSPMYESRVYKVKDSYVTIKKDYLLYQNYRMRYEQFMEMAANGCEICGITTLEILQMDHDHSCCNKAYTCGKCVRGIVCGACNSSIGQYERGKIRSDNPKLEQIITYVNKYKEIHNDARV